jgi:hypothetical protein
MCNDKGDSLRSESIAAFQAEVVGQELKELPGYSHDVVEAYLRRGIVASRLKTANMNQVFTDLTLHGVPQGKSRGMWAGMPFVRPASLGRAVRCLELILLNRKESENVLVKALADFEELNEKLSTFITRCREVAPELNDASDEAVLNDFDSDYSRCVGTAT